MIFHKLGRRRSAEFAWQHLFHLEQNLLGVCGQKRYKMKQLPGTWGPIESVKAHNYSLPQKDFFPK
jgi:hypothetical protein